MERLYDREEQLEAQIQVIADLKEQVRVLNKKKSIDRAFDGSRVPPEQKSELQSAKARVLAAVELYEKSFDEHGNPISKLGEILTGKYKED